MRIVTTSDRLAAAMAAADGIVKGGSVLGSVAAAQLLVAAGRATVVASDGSVSLRASLATSAAEDGAVVVAPHPVAAFAASLPAGSVVTCQVAGGRLVVSSGSVSYRFATVDGDYPAIEEAGGEVQSSPTDGLAAMLAAVRHAVDPRSTMVKVAAEDGHVRMYATDSYRLCVAEHPYTGGRWSILAPVNWLQYALRHNPTRVDIDQRGRLATFHGPEFSVTVRLGAAAFPAVESALVARPALHTRVATRELIAVASRLASVADGEPFRVTIDTTGLTLTVSSGLGDGSERLDAAGDGPGGFGVAVKNLLDAATACGDTLDLYHGDPKQPIWCVGARDGITVHCVVMPTFWQDR